jgi:hypothetical protein
MSDDDVEGLPADGLVQIACSVVTFAMPFTAALNSEASSAR